jgi:hypothetical protein
MGQGTKTGVRSLDIYNENQPMVVKAIFDRIETPKACARRTLRESMKISDAVTVGRKCRGLDRAQADDLARLPPAASRASGGQDFKPSTQAPFASAGKQTGRRTL